jgi:hypothetical protein
MGYIKDQTVPSVKLLCVLFSAPLFVSAHALLSLFYPAKTTVDKAHGILYNFFNQFLDKDNTKGCDREK